MRSTVERRSGRSHTAADEGSLLFCAGRAELRELVTSNQPVGLLAYEAGEPVGWAALAPRPVCTQLRGSPFLVGDADQPGIWSMLCFFVPKSARGKGVPNALVEAACTHAARKGTATIEAIPRESTDTERANLYFGWRALFGRHGFTEVLRPRPTSARVVMRRDLGPDRP
jgi:GNAT superfamily N-acetyltransferase